MKVILWNDGVRVNIVNLVFWLPPFFTLAVLETWIPGEETGWCWQFNRRVHWFCCKQVPGRRESRTLERRYGVWRTHSIQIERFCCMPTPDCWQSPWREPIAETMSMLFILDTLKQIWPKNGSREVKCRSWRWHASLAFSVTRGNYPNGKSFFKRKEYDYWTPDF